MADTKRLNETQNILSADQMLLMAPIPKGQCSSEQVPEQITDNMKLVGWKYRAQTGWDEWEEVHWAISKRIVSLKRGYLCPGIKAGKSVIPVSEKFKVSEDPPPNPSSTMHDFFAFCFNAVVRMYGAGWLEWREDSDDLTDDQTFIPQFFLRQDLSEFQKASLIRLFSMQVTSIQLGAEIRSGLFIADLFWSVMGADSRRWISSWWATFFSPSFHPAFNAALTVAKEESK
ncbi:hypothetical protein OBBRIDRAFT_473958 [Obba rivulosa]|uniref:Uncharacterized protein n=1 Tax=Obba rivulosa TaxID=1052685 RepID=A0A8E2AGU9_9APHY|nr:hypothetical protein OBBRIDRAFT_473958 [Obba rivulosa]